MNTDLFAWEDAQIVDSAEEYQAILNGLRRSQDFALFFVRCSSLGGEYLIRRTTVDLKEKTIATLKFDSQVPSGNIFGEINEFLTFYNQVDVLFIRGAEKSLFDAQETKQRLGWIRGKIETYNWRHVPKVLINLNQQRERFRDCFNSILVFLLPQYAIEYIAHRSPDFFDWRSGTFHYSLDSETLASECIKFLNEYSYSTYLKLPLEAQTARVFEIQELLEEEEIDIYLKWKLLLEQGLLFLSLNDRESEIATYNKAINLIPNSYDVFVRKADALYALKRLDETLACYNSALALRCNSDKSISYESNALHNFGESENSLLLYPFSGHPLPYFGELRPLLGEEQFPDQSLPYFGELRPLLGKEQLQDSVVVFESDLEEQLNRFKLLKKKGCVLFELGRYEEAITTYDAALAFQSDDYEALCNKGIALTKVGRCEEAITAYDTAITIEFDKHEALYNKSVVLDELGRYEEAITAYDTAIAIEFDKHGVVYKKGVSLRRLGRYEEAIAAYDATLVIQPDDYETLYNKGKALDKLGCYEEAITAYNATLAIQPAAANALYNKGKALDKLGCYEEAITAYNATLAIQPDAADAFYNKGKALDKLECYEEANIAYNAALAIQPDDYETLYSKGDVLRKLERYEEAITVYEMALVINSKDHEALYNKILCYALQGKIEPFLENLERVIQLNPEKYRKLAKTDKNFDSIRDDPRFQALIDGKA